VSDDDRSRFIGDPERDPALEPLRQQRQREERARRRLRTAVALTVAAHAALALVRWSQDEPVAVVGPRSRQVARLMPLPKLARPQETAPRPSRPQAVKVPIPDPTPLEPEPVRDPQPLTVADLPSPGDVAGLLEDVLPGPPGPVAAAIRAGTGISEPRKIHDVLPLYPEEARMARVQGTVILDVTLDEGGLVRDIRVLKPLAEGLTEAAIAAVKQWRYEPSRLDGEPVSVLMTVTVTFRLA